MTQTWRNCYQRAKAIHRPYTGSRYVPRLRLTPCTPITAGISQCSTPSTTPIMLSRAAETTTIDLGNTAAQNRSPIDPPPETDIVPLSDLGQAEPYKCDWHVERWFTELLVGGCTEASLRRRSRQSGVPRLAQLREYSDRYSMGTPSCGNSETRAERRPYQYNSKPDNVNLTSSRSTSSGACLVGQHRRRQSALETPRRETRVYLSNLPKTTLDRLNLVGNIPVH
jgi:hypothetical protein